MFLVIVIGSVAALGMLLWVFSRLAWGGGMTKPSYELLRPTTGKLKPLANFAEPERETIEIHCANCSYHRDLPESAQVVASLAHTAATQGGINEGFAACPQCGGTLKSWLRREIVHQHGDQTITFATLRRGAKRRIELNDVLYEHVSDLPEPARELIAEALNENIEQRT